MTTTATDALSFAEYAAIEPGLLQLEERARIVGRQLQSGAIRRCDGWRAWESIKRALDRFVGWHAADEQLSPTEARDVCYRHLLDVFEGAD